MQVDNRLNLLKTQGEFAGSGYFMGYSRGGKKQCHSTQIKERWDKQKRTQKKINIS